MIDPKLGSHHKDQLLAVLFNYMGQDLRQRLMLECPAAYNAACGREVVRVVRSDDGSPVVPGEFRVTRVVLGNAPSDAGCGTCRSTQSPAGDTGRPLSGSWEAWARRVRPTGTS